MTDLHGFELPDFNQNNGKCHNGKGDQNQRNRPSQIKQVLGLFQHG